MGLRINTNVASLQARRHLAGHTAAIGKIFEQLSSGLRINRAGDDPAGLAISERFRARIRSLEQAERNALDGISAVQVAEGALAETGDLLIRMRSLAVQAANGTLSASERASIQQEVDDLAAEIDRIATVTDFNGVPLLAGSGAALFLAIQVDGGGITVGGVDGTTAGLGLSSYGVSTAADARGRLSLFDAALSQLSTLRASFGTAQNRLESAIRSLRIAIENTSAADSRIRDADFAQLVSQLSRRQVLQQAASAVLAQANVAPALALQLLP